MENQIIQDLTWSANPAAITRLASTALGIFLAKSQAMLTAIETAGQSNEYATDPVPYAEVA